MYTYCPVLKWKAGEKNALKGIDTPDDRLMPVFQIVDDEPPTPETFFNQVLSCYKGPFYFDTAPVDDTARGYLMAYIAYACEHQIDGVPFLSADETDEVLFGVSHFNCRFAVSIPVPEDEISTAEILERLTKFNPQKIDLFLEAGVISERQDARIIQAAYIILLSEHKVKLELFNQISVCLSSFPIELDCEAGGIALYNRYDISIFKHLLPLLNNTNSHIAYSDYGVSKFTETNLDPRFLSRVLPKVKYTTNESYVVYKGKKDRYTGQMIRSYLDIARELIESEYYLGEDFSKGDAAIYEKAKQERATPGNAAKWVEFNTNHHIAVLIEQLSNLADL